MATEIGLHGKGSATDRGVPRRGECHGESATEMSLASATEMSLASATET